MGIRSSPDVNNTLRISVAKQAFYCTQLVYMHRICLCTLLPLWDQWQELQWRLFIFIAVEKEGLSAQVQSHPLSTLFIVVNSSLPKKLCLFLFSFWSTWGALRAEEQIRSLTFPMTLTQIPACIDQSACLNGTCPVLFLTMPHPFQSGRNRIENQISDRKDFFFFIIV